MYRYKLRPEVNLEAVAEALPERCTGADLMQVVSTARSAAVRALVSKLHNGNYSTCAGILTSIIICRSFIEIASQLKKTHFREKCV